MSTVQECVTVWQRLVERFQVKNRPLPVSVFVEVGRVHGDVAEAIRMLGPSVLEVVEVRGGVEHDGLGRETESAPYFRGDALPSWVEEQVGSGQTRLQDFARGKGR